MMACSLGPVADMAVAPGISATGFERRWAIALMIAVAIAISYLDRQTLPWALKSIQADIQIGNQTKAFLDSAFLATYGLMYLGGGWLLDRIGTRRGLLIIMIFWSLACASHGFAGGVIALAASRLLLGVGEGGGFPAATRAVAEWFAPRDRAAALGIINAGTAVGAVVAPPLIALILLHANWWELASWRWVFFITGALGLAWAVWWWASYRTPSVAPDPVSAEIERAARYEIGRDRHHQGRPTLLSKEREAEQEEHEGNRVHLRHQHHPGHERGTRTERNLARSVHREVPRQQPAR